MLSIIVPAKNEEQYLPLLLDSIREQSYQDLEVIVADADSVDRTREVALERGCRVVEGGYPDEGRNNGAMHSSDKSDLYLFLDADVILPTPNYLEDCVREINERGLDVASGLIRPIKTGSFFRDIAYEIFYWIHDFGIKSASKGKNPLMANVMFSKPEVHKKIGGFKAFEFGEDSKYVRDAVKEGFSFGVVNEKNKVYISPRRLAQKGFFRMLGVYIYFNAGQILFNKEFRRGESPKKYFD